jgi:hypothetical protein
MRPVILPLAFLFALFCSVSAQADPVVVPLPLNSPVSLSLTANPVITIGNRTIDFTPSLGQTFINFTPVVSYLGGVYPDGLYRITVGIRARDGLASLTGIFPQSPDPAFVNALPVFSVGTKDLLLFDFLIAGDSRPFQFTLTDVNGQTNTPHFSTPIPEPATMFLLGAGLAGVSAAARRKRLRAGRVEND